MWDCVCGFFERCYGFLGKNGKREIKVKACIKSHKRWIGIM